MTAGVTPEVVDLRLLLTGQELRVLRLWFSDLATDEIGERMGLARNTVLCHLTNGRQKGRRLGMGDFAMYALALAQGVLAVPELAREVAGRRSTEGRAAR